MNDHDYERQETIGFLLLFIIAAIFLFLMLFLLPEFWLITTVFLIRDLLFIRRGIRWLKELN